MVELSDELSSDCIYKVGVQNKPAAGCICVYKCVYMLWAFIDFRNEL